MKTKTFEEFLMEKHAEEYIGTKETLVDDFNDWLIELDWDEIVEYADGFNKEMLNKQREEIKERLEDMGFYFYNPEHKKERDYIFKGIK